MTDRRKYISLALLPTQVKLVFLLMGLLFVVTLTALGLVIASNRSLARDGKDAHDVLCTQKLSKTTSYNRGQDILRAQTGDPVSYFGLVIPRAVLKQSQDELREELRQMERLDCTPPPTNTTN